MSGVGIVERVERSNLSESRLGKVTKEKIVGNLRQKRKLVET